MTDAFNSFPIAVRRYQNSPIDDVAVEAYVEAATGRKTRCSHIPAPSVFTTIHRVAVYMSRASHHVGVDIVHGDDERLTIFLRDGTPELVHDLADAWNRVLARHAVLDSRAAGEMAS